MSTKIISTNRKAYHEFHILESYEAGMVLVGSEVKSLREGTASLKEAYIVIRKGEVFLIGAHIRAYSHTGFSGHESVRNRKLLLHKKEIGKIHSKLAEKGLTAVPLKLYFKKGRVKIEFALAKGKKLHDKRDAKKQKDIKREMQREMGKYA
ncbi:MAG: SsrA-binding protein SmpB [Candidatus Marinimicrobia bacterium]|jgi:SsrA-binding protein|nr:SsrA-binding protein SmpB [Candidatus Neomarinimicrobiota bacterium]MBT3496816.1 SsrA-binding protein SmpB [Candidatus Neomarinimicrobiota bacterium]MBT3692666.1 SsrA-binding protein SmpB [Candidatus Neomarinimicrobiota bacterium]MBT3732338.1 SsrA-binding protein SmpB [Candidatus Neomarinimicrobiota bacterium]MBT4144295.1 SsrA-binding protein SmpB [Candidatus Neomarinimicrobiota bacterium]